MEIRKLLGNRVYLNIPEEPKSSIPYVDAETKAALEADKLKKWGRLTVYAVGESVEGLEEGDEVMIDPSAAHRVSKIPLLDGKEVILISYHDIAHIW